MRFLIVIPAFAGMTVDNLDWGQEPPGGTFSTTPRREGSPEGGGGRERHKHAIPRPQSSKDETSRMFVIDIQNFLSDHLSSDRKLRGLNLKAAAEIKDASPSPWRAQQGEIHLFKSWFFAANNVRCCCVAGRISVSLRHTLAFDKPGVSYPIISLATKATAAGHFGLPAEYNTASSLLGAGGGGETHLFDRGFCGKQPGSTAPAVRETALFDRMITPFRQPDENNEGLQVIGGREAHAFDRFFGKQPGQRLRSGRLTSFDVEGKEYAPTRRGTHLLAHGLPPNHLRPESPTEGFP